MTDDRTPLPDYRPGTQPGLCGCLAGVLLLVPFVAVLLFALAWGGAHCEPVPQCQREVERNAALAFASVVAAAVLFALAVRELARWWMMRRFDPVVAGRPPAWAIAVTLLLVAVAASFWGFLIGFY